MLFKKFYAPEIGISIFCVENTILESSDPTAVDEANMKIVVDGPTGFSSS